MQHDQISGARRREILRGTKSSQRSLRLLALKKRRRYEIFQFGIRSSVRGEKQIKSFGNSLVLEECFYVASEQKSSVVFLVAEKNLIAFDAF